MEYKMRKGYALAGTHTHTSMFFSFGGSIVPTTVPITVKILFKLSVFYKGDDDDLPFFESE